MDALMLVIVIAAVVLLPAGTIILYAINCAEEYEKQVEFNDEPSPDGVIRYEGNRRSRTKDINP